MCSRGHWRPAEDEKLRDLVEKYGPHNWNAIAEKLQGRSGESIKETHIIKTLDSFLLFPLFLVVIRPSCIYIYIYTSRAITVPTNSNSTFDYFSTIARGEY